MNKKNVDATGMEIAVIGMACRFPGAGNYREFWENLKNGKECIRFFTEAELEEAGVDPELIKNPDFVRSGGGLLEAKEYFAASFFDYSPREAEIMDPQMRIFHECCWEALEDAGYDPFSYKGLIGLYAGSSSSFYWESLVRYSGKARELGEFAADQLCNRDYLTARVSYKLNLKGANSTLNTACSTSLLAIHQACRALLTADCKIAMAGGVSITASPRWGYMYREGMIMSPDGRTRAFDAGANGTNSGDGAGVAVLKPLKNALSDGDYIHAVIKGTGANNDGNRKVGFTAPSVEGQSEAIRKALRMARAAPETITYIETHGTGTPLGDPVEIEALKRAFKVDTVDKKQFCALGSVKTSIGHLDAAAGAASFIKTVLALKHRQIPASLNFKTPNPKIDFRNSPFYVNAGLCGWKTDGYPLRAGVSSFGIGGTNVHVVLEEWPESTIGRGGPPCPPSTLDQHQLILLSARTGTALDKMTRNLVNYLKQHTGSPGNVVNLVNIGYTLQVGRKSFKYRRRLVGSTADELIGELSSPDSRKVRSFEAPAKEAPVVFMFPGLGAQYINMGRELYEKEPLFRREMDRCFDILKPLMGCDIKDILYPGNAPQSTQSAQRQEIDNKTSAISAVSAVKLSEVNQPVIFVFEYALAKLLMHWGIEPYAMIGYSFGEYTAACVSGVFSPEQALRLVVEREKMIRRIPGGAMLSIPLTAKELEPFLAADDKISLAVDNGDTCIAAGSQAAVDALEKQMKAKRMMCMRLQNTHAIHSAMMDPILEDFAGIMKAIPLKEPRIPYISNVTADWITVEQATDPRYWVRHLRSTVRFAEGIEMLLKEPHTIFVEVGPGTDLSTMIRRYIPKDSAQQVVNLVRNPRREVSDVVYLLNQVGNLWLYGKTIDWDHFYGEEKHQCRRIPLPAYPFERQRYWIEAGSLQGGIGGIAAAPGKTKPVDVSARVEIIRGMEEQLEKQLNIKGITDYEGFESITNRLCTSLICYYFKTCNIGIEPGQVYESKEILKKELNVLPEFEKFLDFFIRVLVEDNIIALEGKKIRFLRGTSDIEDPVPVKEEAGEKFPQFSGTFESLAYCAGHYPAALRGDLEAIGVLFPGGRYFREKSLYQNREEYDNTILYVHLLQRVFFEMVLPLWKSQNKKTFRILEVGAGTGSLTRRLLMGLNEENKNKDLSIQYHFTDIGKFFVVNARKEAAKQGWDFMRFGVLDISGDPVAQGYQAYSFDMVLGLNVVHATPDIALSMENLKKLLAPNGIMVVIEGTNPPRWMNMIDGLAEGWWYFEDGGLRKGSPLLSPGQWETVMRDRGFENVMVFPREEEKRGETRCCMAAALQEGAIPIEKDVEAIPEVSTSLYRRPDLSSEYIAPGSELERVLVEIFQNFFGIDQVGIEDDFFELGMDSLIATTLASRFQEKFNIRIPLADIYDAANIRRLGQYIESMESGPDMVMDENLLLLRKGSDVDAHLFIVHAGSGEAAVYMEFCSRLDTRFNCWGIRSDRPGHYGPENITIEEIAQKYLEKIQKVQPEGPYYIAGWSAGGAIAFEMVRLLEQMNKEIGFLGVISSTAPQKDWWYDAGEFTLKTEREWIKSYFPEEEKRINKELKRVSGISQLWSWVVDYLEGNNITIEILGRLVPEFMKNAIPGNEQMGVREWVFYLNMVRSYMNAQAFYIPVGKVKTRVHFFEAEGTEVFNREKWNNYTEMPIKEYRVKGTHNSIFEMPDVVVFANRFNEALT